MIEATLHTRRAFTVCSTVLYGLTVGTPLCQCEV
jgi:hypothetical protein